MSAPEKIVIGNAELWHGDCRDVLPMLAGVDAVITDPPYGIALQNNWAGDRTRTSRDYRIQGDECQTVGLEALEWAIQRKLPTLFFASPHHPWPGEWRNLLVWDKSGAVGGGGDTKTCWKQSWELIQIARNGPLSGGRDEGVIRWPVNPQASALHSCQKPVGLMAYLITKMAPDRPLDMFMGSGSTGVACVQTGRAFVGIEIDRAHFDTACERIARAHAQGSLLPLDAAPMRQEQAGIEFGQT